MGTAGAGTGFTAGGAGLGAGAAAGIAGRGGAGPPGAGGVIPAAAIAAAIACACACACACAWAACAAANAGSPSGDPTVNPEGNPSLCPPGEVPGAPIIARGAPYGEKPCAGDAMPGNPPGTGRAPAAAAAAAASGVPAGFLSPSFSAPASPWALSGSGFLKSPFTSSFESGFTMRIALLLRCCTTGGVVAGFIGPPGWPGPGESRTGAPPGPPKGEPGPPIPPMPPMPPMPPGIKPAGMPPGPIPPGKPYGIPPGGMPPGRPPIMAGGPPGTPPKGNAGAPLGAPGWPGWPPGPPGIPPNGGTPIARADPPESRGPGGAFGAPSAPWGAGMWDGGTPGCSVVEVEGHLRSATSDKRGRDDCGAKKKTTIGFDSDFSDASKASVAKSGATRDPIGSRATHAPRGARRGVGGGTRGTRAIRGTRDSVGCDVPLQG